MKRIGDSIGFAFVLNLLFPGLGHGLWREYLFGAFVFLISLLASTLFFTSLLVPLPTVAKLLLFGLPTLFYLVTFVDLARTVRSRRRKTRFTWRRGAAMLAAALVFQIAVPIAPGNYLLRNTPEVFTVRDGDYAPWVTRGDVAISSPLALRANVFFLSQPIWLELPEYGEVIRFQDASGTTKMGLVLGYFGDQAEVVDGELYVNGQSIDGALEKLRLGGQDLPLTSADGASIMVGTLKLGTLSDVHQIAPSQVIGRVYRLF